MNILERWNGLIEQLPPKDYKILATAILTDSDKPMISLKYQYIADTIYTDVMHLKQTNERKKKHRSKNVPKTFQERSEDVPRTQEEKREASPPCSPSSFPPHPLINSPYNPPLEEKREEALTGVCAGACEDEQISFEGFEPLDPPESEVKRRKPTIAERFDALWAEYPKKNGKKNAFESYQRALKDGVTDEVIADGIKRYKEHIATKHTEDKYILIGSSYFQQRRWEDEYDTASAAPTYRENSGGDEFLNYLNEELDKEKAKRESRWTEQT